MVTINEYEAHYVKACIDCLEAEDYFAAKLDEFTGDFLDHAAFSRNPCHICGSTLAGERVGGTYLTVTTTTR